MSFAHDRVCHATLACVELVSDAEMTSTWHSATRIAMATLVRAKKKRSRMRGVLVVLHGGVYGACQCSGAVAHNTLLRRIQPMHETHDTRSTQTPLTRDGLTNTLQVHDGMGSFPPRQRVDQQPTRWSSIPAGGLAHVAGLGYSAWAQCWNDILHVTVQHQLPALQNRLASCHGQHLVNFD